MIFHKWDTVHNYNDKLYIMVDNNFVVDKDQQCYYDFFSFDIDMIKNKVSIDFIDNSNNNIMLYIAFNKKREAGLESTVVEHMYSKKIKFINLVIILEFGMMKLVI